MIILDYLFYPLSALLYVGQPKSLPLRGAFLMSVLYYAVLAAAGMSLLCHVAGGAWMRSHVYAIGVGNWLLLCALFYLTYRRYKDAYPLLAARWAHEQRGMALFRTLLAIGAFLLVLLQSYAIVRALPF